MLSSKVKFYKDQCLCLLFRLEFLIFIVTRQGNFFGPRNPTVMLSSKVKFYKDQCLYLPFLSWNVVPKSVGRFTRRLSQRLLLLCAKCFALRLVSWLLLLTAVVYHLDWQLIHTHDDMTKITWNYFFSHHKRIQELDWKNAIEWVSM